MLLLFSIIYSWYQKTLEKMQFYLILSFFYLLVPCKIFIAENFKNILSVLSNHLCNRPSKHFLSDLVDKKEERDWFHCFIRPWSEANQLTFSFESQTASFNIFIDTKYSYMHTAVYSSMECFMLQGSLLCSY